MNVSSIQNMFQGNPFTTPIGALIEKATDPTTATEDWGLLMDIVDNINRSDSGPRDATRALRKRMSTSLGKNNAAIMLSLTCTETCVKNCGYRFHVQVASKEFLHELIKIVDYKTAPSQMLQTRILGLLQSWSDAFRGEPELREVEKTVIELRQRGYEFPMTDVDHMAPIHTPRRSVMETPVLPKQSNLQHQPPPPSVPPGHPSARMHTHSQAHTLPSGMVMQHAPPQPARMAHTGAAMTTTGPVSAEVTGPVTPTSDQVSKLTHDLQVVTGNVRVFNEMLNELSPTGISPEDLSLMQELHRTCRAMQQRIMELLEQLAHEELTSELLRINDDLNNVFVRYGRFERYRSQQKGGAEAAAAAAAAADPQQHQNNASPPPPSYNQAMSSEPGAASLIDLNDPNDLSQRLADVRVSGESAGAQLSKVHATAASNAAQVDEFDAFAQSRTRTGSGAAEPTATSLAGAMQSRNAGDEDFIPGIPDSKEELDEMERWMATHDSASVPMSSSEFDQFLAEHGAGSAVNQPAPPPPPSRRQMKDDDKEGALFAL